VIGVTRDGAPGELAWGNPTRDVLHLDPERVRAHEWAIYPHDGVGGHLVRRADLGKATLHAVRRLGLDRVALSADSPVSETVDGLQLTAQDPDALLLKGRYHMVLGRLGVDE
jgi:hypothetical protein